MLTDQTILEPYKSEMLTNLHLTTARKQQAPAYIIGYTL